MNRYHYVSVDAAAFLQISKMPVPKDSYLSEDVEARTFHVLLNKGYRFVCFAPNANLALFEKAINATQNYAIELAKADAAP